jgi:hypothetical protein
MEYLWKYIDNTRTRVPKNRMYISWKDSTTHFPFTLSTQWEKNNLKTYFENEMVSGSSGVGLSFDPITLNSWINGLKWTDDIIRDIILGFRERGLEDETLFIMYVFRFLRLPNFSATAITDVNF